MTHSLRRVSLIVLVALPILAGCAGDGCEYLTFETRPEAAPPLVMPEGVPAPAETGKLRVPELSAAENANAGTCMATPPMTLPEDVLVDPEEASEAG